jgi:hypothetical protein
MSSPMMTSDNIQELAKALHKAKKSIGNVSPNKNGRNYKYADLASIIDATRGPLEDNGLMIIQGVVQAQMNGIVAISTRLMHTTGEFLECTYDIPMPDFGKTKDGRDTVNIVQKMGAAITYGRRYGLASVLGIAVDEDIDAASEQDHRGHAADPPPQVDWTLTKAMNAIIKDNAHLFNDEEKKRIQAMMHYDPKAKNYSKPLDAAQHSAVKKYVDDIISRADSQVAKDEIEEMESQLGVPDPEGNDDLFDEEDTEYLGAK